MLIEALAFIFFFSVGLIGTMILSPFLFTLPLVMFVISGMKETVAWIGLLFGFGLGTVFWVDIAGIVDIRPGTLVRRILGKKNEVYEDGLDESED